VLEAVPSERVEALAGKGVSGVKAMTAHENLMSRLKVTYVGMYKDEEEQKGKQRLRLDEIQRESLIYSYHLI